MTTAKDIFVTLKHKYYSQKKFNTQCCVYVRNYFKMSIIHHTFKTGNTIQVFNSSKICITKKKDETAFRLKSKSITCLKYLHTFDFCLSISNEIILPSLYPNF